MNAKTITVYYLSTDVPLQLKFGVMKNKSKHQIFFKNKRLWEDNMLFKRFFVKTFQDIKHEHMHHV